MITNKMFWEAIDRLAAANNVSCSHLSKSSGMYPTTSNKSKRKDTYGKKRWLSVWSLLKILEATNTN